MKLEAGKYYKTRDGRKAYVAAIAPEVCKEYPVIGWLFFECGDVLHAGWLEGGNVLYNDIECDTDLIAEWTEPEVKGERWVYAKYAVIRTDADGKVTKEDLYLTTEAPNQLSDMRFYVGRIKLKPME